MNNPFTKILSESYRLSPPINEAEETPEQQRIRLDAKQKAKEYVEKILKTKQQKDFLDALAKKELEKYASEEPGDYNIEEAEEAKPDFSKMTDAEKAEYVRKKYSREIPPPPHQPTSLPKPPAEKHVGKEERPRDELGYLDEPERPLPPPKEESLDEYFYYYYGKPKPEGEPENPKVSKFSTMTPQEKYDLVAKLQMIKYGKVYAKPPAGMKPHKVDEDTFHFPASGHFPSEPEIDVKSMGKRIELPEPGGHTTTFFHKEFEKEHPEIPKHPKAKTAGTGSPYAWAAGAYDQPAPKTKTGTSVEEINETDQPRPSNDMSVPTNPDFASGTAPVEEKIEKLGIDRNQLKMGIKAELKDGHTTDPLVAAKIAMDHLVNEDPKYYTKLNKAGLEEVTGTATYPNPPPPKKYTYTKQAQVGPYPDYSTKVNVKGGDYAKEVKPFIDPTQTKSSKIEGMEEVEYVPRKYDEPKHPVISPSDPRYKEKMEKIRKEKQYRKKGMWPVVKPIRTKKQDIEEPETDLGPNIVEDEQEKGYWKKHYRRDHRNDRINRGRDLFGQEENKRDGQLEESMDEIQKLDLKTKKVLLKKLKKAKQEMKEFVETESDEVYDLDKPETWEPPKKSVAPKYKGKKSPKTDSEKPQKVYDLDKELSKNEMIVNKDYPQSSLDLGWVNVEEATYSPMPSFLPQKSGKRIGRKTYYPKIEGVLNTEHHGQRIILGKIIQPQPFRVQEILKKFSKVFLVKNSEARRLVKEMKHAPTDTERLIAEAKLVMLLKNELDQ